MNVKARFMKVVQSAIRADCSYPNEDRIKQQENEFFPRWTSVIYSSSETQFSQNWAAFVAIYGKPPFRQIITYLEDGWFNHRQHFVRAWTDKILHFGHLATSRAEGAHAMLKRYLEASVYDLQGTVKRIGLTLDDRAVEYRAAISAERNKRPIQLLRNTIFSQVLGKISAHALYKVRDAYSQSEKSEKPCQGVMARTMGLPCAHILRQRAASSGTLCVTDFHPHWHLYPPSEFPPPDLYSRLLEPAVRKGPGRPRGARNEPHSSQPDRSTKRSPSEFELETSKRRKRKADKGSGGGNVAVWNIDRTGRTVGHTDTAISQESMAVLMERATAAVTGLAEANIVEKSRE